MWKNSSYVFVNPDNQSYIISRLEEFFSINAPSSQNNLTLWNSHKAYTRGILIQLSSRLIKDRNKKMDELLEKIEILETKINVPLPHLS